MSYIRGEPYEWFGDVDDSGRTYGDGERLRGYGVQYMFYADHAEFLTRILARWLSGSEIAPCKQALIDEWGITPKRSTKSYQPEPVGTTKHTEWVETVYMNKDAYRHFEPVDHQGLATVYTAKWKYGSENVEIFGTHRESLDHFAEVSMRVLDRHLSGEILDDAAWAIGSELGIDRRLV